MNLASQNMLAASEIWLYLLPGFGCALLFYGIWQVLTETKVSNQKKMQERLRGERTQQDKVTESILRRSSTSATMADAIVGKFKFVAKLQVLLDQSDLQLGHE